MKKILLLLLLGFVFVAGCSEQLPPDMPKLYPAQLTLTQGGKPFEGVMVIANHKEASSHYSSGGISDANGIVVLRTHGKYRGVPEGTYALALSKREIVVEGGQTTQFQVIDPKLGAAATSGLEVTVNPPGLKETLDIPVYRQQIIEERKLRRLN